MSDWNGEAGLFVLLMMFVLWAAKAAYGYWTWSLPQMMEDLKTGPLPLNAVGLSFWQRLMEAYNDIGEVKKSTRIKLHTAITLFLAIGLFLQFIKIIRQKQINMHRWVGRAVIVVALLATPSFGILIAGLPFPIAQYFEYPVLFAIPYFGIKGWLQIRNKQVMDHKASMIMFSSCFFYFGVQRLVMIAFGRLHSGPWAKFTPLGPWSEWTEKEYELFFGLSIALAFPITFGVAIGRAYVLQNLPKQKEA